MSSSFNTSPKPHPSHLTSWFLLGFILLGIAGSLALLLSVEDPVRLKALIEDQGPVQGLGLSCVALSLLISLFFALTDSERRASYIRLSYLLLFYTLREADFHYKLSEHAKATQFKRFFLHDQIPLSSKIFLATIVILFLFTLYQYLRNERQGFLLAVQQRLPWALFAVAWAGAFVMSQIVDQVPLFHNVSGQVAEEVLESSAQIFALVAMILFRIQAQGNRLTAAAGAT